MLFYANVFKKTSCYKPVNSSIALSSFPKISIIIPARNEEKNIGPLLLSIQQQTIATEKFEVIIVDDFSTDRTAAIVQQFAFAKLIQLKNVVGTQHINSYKKKAIETGIAHCNGELIVTTDADCSVPKKWLETIAAFYLQHKPEFIVMPVAINHNNRFIEIFQALDFMGMQGITATMVHHM
ncbi:MAG: glycosyltransferase, partial [Ferruginibacter sp.]